MTNALLLLLPSAVGFALSPIPLVEIILVLLSNRARKNALLFLACIAVPVFAIPMLSAEGLAAGSQGRAGGSELKDWIFLALGVLLLTMAVRNFLNRKDKSVPKAFAAIDNMGPAGVVALSGGATVLNPKNLVLLLGAGAIVGAAGLSLGELATVLGVFTLIATLPFSLAVAYVILGGDTAEAQMQRVKQWLLDNNKMTMAVVLGVIGLSMTTKALAALLG